MSAKRSYEQQQEGWFVEFVNILSLKHLDPKLGKLLRVYLILTCLVVIPLSGFWHLLGESSKSARATNCLSNVKDTAVAMLMYASDGDERLPIAKRWTDSLDSFLKDKDRLFPSRYSCPLEPEKSDRIIDYAFFRRLSGVKTTAIAAPNRTPMIFESVPVPRNTSGYLTLLPDPPRHKQNVIGYADGHVSRIDRD